MRFIPLMCLLACHVENPQQLPPPSSDVIVEHDVDGDGVTAEDGDCDDGSPEVFPGAPDVTCDGLDGDCDGDIDEDFDLDPQEGFTDDLGDMGSSGEAFRVGYLFPEGDVDAFRFEVSDDWGWFSVEAFIYGVDPDLDVALELVRVSDGEVVAEADLVGIGGYETLDFGGTPAGDDSGEYTLIVRGATGSTCSTPYTLQILVGGV